VNFRLLNPCLFSRKTVQPTAARFGKMIHLGHIMNTCYLSHNAPAEPQNQNFFTLANSVLQLIDRFLQNVVKQLITAKRQFRLVSLDSTRAYGSRIRFTFFENPKTRLLCFLKCHVKKRKKNVESVVQVSFPL